MKTKHWPLIFIGGLWTFSSGLVFSNIIWAIIGIILLIYSLKLRRLKHKYGGNQKWHLIKKQNEM